LQTKDILKSAWSNYFWSMGYFTNTWHLTGPFQ